MALSFLALLLVTGLKLLLIGVQLWVQDTFPSVSLSDEQHYAHSAH